MQTSNNSGARTHPKTPNQQKETNEGEERISKTKMSNRVEGVNVGTLDHANTYVVQIGGFRGGGAVGADENDERREMLL